MDQLCTAVQHRSFISHRFNVPSLHRHATRAVIKIAGAAIATCVGLAGFGSVGSHLGSNLGLIGMPPAAAAERGGPVTARNTEILPRDNFRGFRAFLESLLPQAIARGIARARFESVIRELTPDPAVARASGRQSEFARPFSAYFSAAVGPRRIAQGRALAAQWRAPLAEITHRYGVPGSVLLAAWGMESDFGHAMGGKDVIRSLATLAFLRRDRSLFRDEFLDALLILKQGAVARATMTGSWAGAMGGPQFLPSTYLARAVSYSGTAAPDIWTNVPDILASIAKFLNASGWQRNARWGMEVRLPAHFDYATLHADFREWEARGLRRADGSALPRAGAATLFFPAGARGPAFLLGNNYWVIKAYNNSDAYALSLACLADRIAGAQGLYTPWPSGVKLWRHAERAEIQRLLQRLSYYKGTIDGRFGPSSREAIHAFQRAVGDHPADGVGGANLLAKLRKQAGE